MTSHDQHGLTVSGTAAATAEYDRAVTALLHFQPAVVDAADKAVAEDPTFAMGHALRAYLRLLSGEPADTAAAVGEFTAARPSIVTNEPRERAHVAAVEQLLAGDWYGAAAALRDLVRAWPRDALALMIGHQLDFFLGDAVSLRDRVGGVLTSWSAGDPLYGPVLGMYAFGLEEAGHYDRSEDVGLAAVELDAKDVWGIHAVVHTYEMQGRFGDGVRYLDARAGDWTAGNFFTVHTWWHYGLYALEAGNEARALEIYDAALRPPAAMEVALALADAAALLWRLHLDGGSYPSRWAALAAAWPSRDAVPFNAFNDMHATMSYVGAGRFADAERLIASRRSFVDSQAGSVANHRMTAVAGLPVCAALLAFGQGAYERCVELLWPIRYQVNALGGSHAQRDAVQRTLVEACLRAGLHDQARTLISERINVRPCSPYNWLSQARLASSIGDSVAASLATERATAARTAAAVLLP